MLTQKTLKRHAGLVDRMASKLGLDLQEEALRGNVSIFGIEDAVLACAGCAQVGKCEAFLDDEARAETTPEYCRNGTLFAELRNG